MFYHEEREESGAAELQPKAENWKDAVAHTGAQSFLFLFYFSAPLRLRMKILLLSDRRQDLQDEQDVYLIPILNI